jgi:anti-sigma factor RsiW
VTCPDLVVLSQLVDGELPASDAAAIHAHVGGCDACRASLRRLERATNAARMLLSDEPRSGGAVGVDCVAPERIAGWAARALAADERHAVERHLSQCDGCLADALAMARVTARLAAGPTLAVPATLRERVASRWAPASAEETLTSLVIRIARAGVALVERHVVAPILDAEALPLAGATVRAGDGPDGIAFRIRAPEAEVRGTIVTTEGTVGLTLTLRGTADDALGGQRVFLRRHGRSIYSARTDAAGALEMPRVEPGVYEVSCPGIGTSFRLDLRA